MLNQVEPAPGQESVWDYPRPPRVDPTSKLVQVVFNGVVIAETHGALRVLETSHPPAYYLPPADIRMEHLVPTAHASFCEFKGTAVYWTVVVGERRAENAAWGYRAPLPGYEAIAGFVSFYPGRMDRCTVDGEVVTPQDGSFYGGWITSDIVGPFKGGPGTRGW